MATLGCIFLVCAIIGCRAGPTTILVDDAASGNPVLQEITMTRTTLLWENPIVPWSRGTASQDFLSNSGVFHVAGLGGRDILTLETDGYWGARVQLDGNTAYVQSPVARLAVSDFLHGGLWRDFDRREAVPMHLDEDGKLEVRLYRRCSPPSP
jgi:hypothetical protein